MRKILNNLIDWSFSSRAIGDMVLVLLGLLIITGGRIGIQVTPEREVKWIEVFADMDSWIGWALIWLAGDDMLFRGKATIFLLSKTIVPVVETILKAILGEEQFNRLIKRLKEKMDKGEIEEAKGGGYESHQGLTQ